MIGGSVGGLAVAHELRAIGVDVTVYERSVDRTQPRGAGIVMQPEVEGLLRSLGRSVPSVSVELTERQQLHRDGRVARYHAPQWMTAWDTLYTALREPLPAASHRLDSTLAGLSVEDRRVTATFADGHTAEADLLIGADGVGSTTRTLAGIHGCVTYPGYVAFRGLEPEDDLPEPLRSLLAERFTSFGAPGMQMLSYLVPGANGERHRGARRVNWVWYLNTPERDLGRLLTGRSGRHYENFLPPGESTQEVDTALATLAEKALPERFAELVALSAVFMQPVFDRAPSRMVADRVMLIGDAAGTVRPHTASGTSKALGDAAALAYALEGWQPPAALPARRLAHWEDQRLAHVNAVAGAGIRLAAQSMLGAAGPDYRLAAGDDGGQPTRRAAPR